MSSDSPRPPQERSLPELIGDLSAQTARLVREEIALARAELRQKLVRSLGGAILLAMAAAAGLICIGALGATLILALSLAMPAWGAALIVTAAAGLVAALVGLVGARALRRNLPPIPDQAIETLREDWEWARTRK